MNTRDKWNEIYIYEFNKILADESIIPNFQPILKLSTGKIIGYDVMYKLPSNSIFRSYKRLLEFSLSINKIWDINYIINKKILKSLMDINDQMLLFIPICMHELNSNGIVELLTNTFVNNSNLSPENIVLKFSEKEIILEYNNFKKNIDFYKAKGFIPAIDEVCTAHSGIKILNDIHPHYIILNEDVITDIDTDIFKQSLTKAFVDSSLVSNLNVIAKGITKEEELKTLIKLGVHSGQGNYINKPTTLPTTPPENLQSKIKNHNALWKNIKNYSSDFHYISHLINDVNSFSPNSKCNAINVFFENNKSSGVCITENHFPVGLVMKNMLNSAMSKRYGYAVYSNRPISLIMNQFPLIVDYYTPINIVAHKAMERDDLHIYDDIIVTKGNKYAGMVTMKSLLHYAIDYEKNYAKQLNPLTGLPGNTIINKILNDIVTCGSYSCICYADLDNFKVYNDVYGFENGDRIITLTANILQSVIKQNFPYASFVGHIGGDDFIFVVDSHIRNIKICCQEIINQFDTNLKSFFNTDDLVNGFLETEDRYGNKMKFNLTSISISGLYGDLTHFNSPENLGQCMALLKKQTKKVPGSSFLLEKSEEVIENHVSA